MGIRIDGATDLINASDGSLTIEGQSINTTGIVTATGGMKVGSAATIHSTGQFNIGVAATIFTNGNATYSGIVTATSFVGGLPITSGADNRVITASSASAIQGESTLNYNGTRLDIDSSAQNILQLNSTDSDGPNVLLQRSGSAFGYLGSAAANTGGTATDLSLRAQGNLLLAIGGDERLRIRVDGRVAIASSLAVTGVCTAAAFAPSGAEQQLSHRNVWMNGAAQIAQRGASQTSISSYGGTPTGGPDRTSYLMISNHGTWTFSQDSDGPPGFAKCYNLTATTGDGSVAADAAVRWWQKFEGQDLQRFMKGTADAKQFTLSFWVKSTTTGAYAVELLDYDNSNRGVTRTYTISQAATWEYKTVTFPADTSGAFDNDNAASFACEFWLCAGSDYTSGGADASWHAYNDTKRAGGHTANAGGSNNDYHRITGIQLEAGDVATPYEHKSYAEELAACQRYYYRETIDNNDFFTGMGMADVDGNTVILNLPLPVTMRQTPTFEQTGTAGNYMIRRSTTQQCTSVPSLGSASTPYQASISFIKSSHGWGDGSAVRCGSWGGSHIAFSAEL